MKPPVPLLAPLLRSVAQGKILARVLLHPEDEFTLPELVEASGVPRSTVWREVEHALAAGVVVARRVGGTRVVRADTSSPLFPAMAELLAVSFGAPAVLAAELAGVDGVTDAYIFGSYAARYAGIAGRPPNDIDVLVVGTPDRDAVHQAASRAEAVLRREVHVTIRRAEDVADPASSFMATVRSRPLLRLDLGGGYGSRAGGRRR